MWYAESQYLYSSESEGFNAFYNLYWNISFKSVIFDCTAKYKCQIYGHIRSQNLQTAFDTETAILKQWFVVYFVCTYCINAIVAYTKIILEGDQESPNPSLNLPLGENAEFKQIGIISTVCLTSDLTYVTTYVWIIYRFIIMYIYVNYVFCG